MKNDGLPDGLIVPVLNNNSLIITNKYFSSLLNFVERDAT